MQKVVFFPLIIIYAVNKVGLGSPVFSTPVNELWEEPVSELGGGGALVLCYGI